MVEDKSVSRALVQGKGSSVNYFMMVLQRQKKKKKNSKHFLVAMAFCSIGIHYSNQCTTSKGIDQNARVAMVAIVKTDIFFLLY